MSGDVLLAIDQGTTNTKVLAVDPLGHVVAASSVRTELTFPRPGWAESDAASLVASTRRALERCLDELGPVGVAALGISNQRETAVAWDRATLTPLGPAVSWQCTRSAALCDRLRAEGHGPRVRALTGLDLAPMFAAGKMAWLLDHIDHGRERAADGSVCLGTVDSWLLACLTGGRAHATDLTNASRTQLLDIGRGEWSDELLSIFDIPRAALPSILASADDFGTCVLPSGAEVPVASMIGDSHAAAVGHGVLHPGSVKATFGTGTSVLAPVATASEVAGLSGTITWSRRTASGIESVRGVEGNIYATGAALELAAHLVGLGADVAALESHVAPHRGSGADVYFVPALSGLGAPHWDATATGTIIGLTRGSDRADIATAAFEAVAFQVRDVLAAVPAGAAGRLLHVDGGAMRSDRLAGLVADVTGRVVVRATVAELSALGAAYLAGHRVGWWPDWADIDAVRFPTDTFEPAAPGAWDQRHARWTEAVRHARGWHASEASDAPTGTRSAS